MVCSYDSLLHWLIQADPETAKEALTVEPCERQLPASARRLQRMGPFAMPCASIVDL